jgi:sugar/nucleoside kinase (ribokinase family)
MKIISVINYKDGAQAYTKDKNVSIPGNIVDVVDITGAGDSFIKINKNLNIVKQFKY